MKYQGVTGYHLDAATGVETCNEKIVEDVFICLTFRLVCVQQIYNNNGVREIIWKSSVYGSRGCVYTHRRSKNTTGLVNYFLGRGIGISR